MEIRIILIFLILIHFKFKYTNCEIKQYILHGPSEEKDLPGFWGPWEECEPNTYVIGFKVKSENSRVLRKNEVESGDTFGLSGIELICGIAGNLTYLKKITSNVAAEGEWSRAKFCEGYAVGFEVKLEDEKKQKKGDFVGATNVRMQCSARREIIEHHLDYQPGFWSEPELCLRNQAVCGLRTKTKIAFENEDLVGLSSLKLKCCNLNFQSEICIPRDGLELLFDYDNRLGLQTVTYSYTLTVGVSQSTSVSDSKHKDVVGNGMLGVEYQVGNGTREVQGRRKRSLKIPRKIRNKNKDRIQDDLKNNIYENMQFNLRQMGNPFPVPPPDPIPPPINPAPAPAIPPGTFPIPTPPVGTVPVLPMPPGGAVPVMPPGGGGGAPVMPMPPGAGNATQPAQPVVCAPMMMPPAIFNPSVNTEMLRIYTLNAYGTLSTGYNWGTSGSSTWSPARTTKVSVNIPPGHSISIYQVVGVCGDIIIRPEKIFQNGTYLEEKARSATEDNSWGGFLYFNNFVNQMPSILNDFFNVGKKFAKIIKLL